jgi:signal transduction histidine kinase/CheY-like chemotaxis protein
VHDAPFWGIRPAMQRALACNVFKLLDFLVFFGYGSAVNSAGMSVSSPNQSSIETKGAFRAKPYSMERRFGLMQAGTLAVALLLVSGAFYWNLSFRDRLASSLQRLDSTLSLNREIHVAQERVTLAFWEAYDLQPTGSVSRYDECARAAADTLRRYDSISLSAQEQAEVDRLHDLQQEFLAQTSGDLAREHDGHSDTAERDGVGKLSGQIEATLARVEQIQIQQLEGLNAEMGQFSRWLTLLLLLVAALAMLTMVLFKYVHRLHLWEPIEGLRRMVGEVRRGNLNLTGEIPESVELGSLVGAFLAMAGELREMRQSLEDKVAERTIRLEEAQKELFQSAKLASLGQLVSGVAHEINNPLTSILGFSEVVLNRSGTDPAIRAPLRTIRYESMRLRHLVANLTTFARRAPHRTQRLDLRQVLDRVVDLRGYQLEANNISLHLSAPEKPLWLIGDPDQLLQVMLNMVSNAEQAIKEIRERGDVWLSCGAEGERAWFAVRDNGAGMTPEVHSHIFDPFFTTKPTGQGTGLGLSISHGIIQQHQGAIAVESTPRDGTTFHVSLRLEPVELSSQTDVKVTAPESSRAGKQAVHQTRHVLVIDDENSILEMISAALERLNCRTTLVCGSAGADAALEQPDIDLVICDLKMPGRNGLEVYRLFRGKRPDLDGRFLLMTGNLADADQHAVELASVPILSKPFALARLREAVEQILKFRTPA